jgi:hypothetical protein
MVAPIDLFNEVHHLNASDVAIILNNDLFKMEKYHPTTNLFY